MDKGRPRRAAGGARGAAGRTRQAGVSALAITGSLLVAAAGWPTRAVAPGAPVGQARVAAGAVSAVLPGAPATLPHVASLGRLRQADLLVVSARPLPSAASSTVAKLPGVTATESVDAARIAVNGRYAAVLGVDPSGFRRFAARPTAVDTTYWRDVAAGDIGLSYTMGKQDRLPPGSQVAVVGRRRETLMVGGLGTVGVAGVDAVVSHTVARSLGFPMGNAMVVSAPHAHLRALVRKIRARIPTAEVMQLLTQQARAKAGQAGAPTGVPLNGLVTVRQVRSMLRAALSRVGMPYVWGAAGPSAFDCSGLVQWSFRQAGVVMPRVAADQARTGRAVQVSQLQPGDLLFYHTDPTAPHYISHVAIYLGGGKMIQAPQPGQHVEVVPVDLGREFAGAIKVSPRVAALVAGSPIG